MKKLLILLASGVLLAGCNYQNMLGGATPTTAPAEGEGSPTESMVKQEAMKTVALDGQNNSGLSGTAILKETDGKMMVTVQLTGKQGTTPMPAHIHVGSCPKPGAVKWPLTDVADGKSETTLDVDMATIEAAGPLAVNVHKSAKEMANYVACGDVK